jgi:hypothetical protein
VGVLVSSKGQAVIEELPTDITFEVLLISLISALCTGTGTFNVARALPRGICRFKDDHTGMGFQVLTKCCARCKGFCAFMAVIVGFLNLNLLIFTFLFWVFYPCTIRLIRISLL